MKKEKYFGNGRLGSLERIGYYDTDDTEAQIYISKESRKIAYEALKNLMLRVVRGNISDETASEFYENMTRFLYAHDKNNGNGKKQESFLRLKET